jgi:nitroimidazol reductase NimA-like FMN-containing flavoprotein (pyridoxamine 5'-phosphate oxidase superfamily)
MRDITPTPRTQVRRLPKRGVYDRDAIDAILDEALICHLGFVVDGQPYVIPTIHCRVEDRLYVHGSAASRMLGALGSAAPVCATVTLLDGIVLARSAYHHSMNYRSVVVLGQAREVSDAAERLQALEAIVEHVVPGRWRDVRGPSEQELRATSVLALPIDEASAKIRTGPPIDDESDYALPCWAGVLPLALVPGALEADPRLAPGIAAPPSLAAYSRPGQRRPATRP